MSFGPSERFALLFAVGVTAYVWIAWGRPRAALAIGVVAYVPVLVVAFFSRQFDLAGWHGFMHASPIYQMMERHTAPPEETLYAGVTLRYPWVEHWLLARLGAITGFSVHYMELGIEAIALVVFLGSIAWLASAFTDDRRTIATAALFGIYGVSIFHMSFFLELIGRVFPTLWLETRVVPIDKYLNFSAMPNAFAAMAAAAAAAVHLVRGAPHPRRLAAIISAAVLITAFVHPPSWFGVLAWTGMAGLVLLWHRTPEDRRRALLLTLAVGIPSLIAVPYIHSIGDSQSTRGWTGLTDAWQLFVGKLGDEAFFFATFAAMAIYGRAEIVRRIRERDRATMVCLGVVPMLALAYLLVRAPGRNEYKFLLLLSPALAVFMALSFERLAQRARVVAFALLFLLMIPPGRVLGSRPWFIVTDPVRTDGPYLRALDPQADSLYQFIATQTPKDAVFIATDLRVPPLGRRSLYVALEAPWRGRDGWGTQRNDLLQEIVRRADAEMYRRQRYATTVLNPDWALPPSAVMTLIEADVPGRPIYVHAPWATAMEKLDATPGFARVFANGAGAVYAYAATPGSPHR